MINRRKTMSENNNVFVFVGRYPDHVAEVAVAHYPGKFVLFPDLTRLLPNEYQTWIDNALDDNLDHEIDGIVVVANDPVLLDLVPIEQVICFDGENHCPISEHHDWPYWRGNMTPGEFWGYVGYSWVTERLVQS
jgi:hypothetical protein